MQYASSTTQDSVITAYQAARNFADRQLEAEINPFRLELDAARLALEHARDNDLKAMESDYDRSYLSVMRQYEVDYRAAQNDNGQAFTAVLKAMDAGKKASDARYEEKVARAQSAFQQTCEQCGGADSPAALPYADQLAAAIYAADEERQKEAVERQAQYRVDKERLDGEHEERLARLKSERDLSLASSRTRYEKEEAALRQPLEARLSTAAEAFTQAEGQAMARHQRLRLQRLHIWNLYLQGEVSAERSIQLFRTLGQN